MYDDLDRDDWFGHLIRLEADLAKAARGSSPASTSSPSEQTPMVPKNAHAITVQTLETPVTISDQDLTTSNQSLIIPTDTSGQDASYQIPARMSATAIDTPD